MQSENLPANVNVNSAVSRSWSIPVSFFGKMDFRLLTITSSGIVDFSWIDDMFGLVVVVDYWLVSSHKNIWYERGNQQRQRISCVFYEFRIFKKTALSTVFDSM